VQVLGNGYGCSLVPRPSTTPVFDRLQYVKSGGVEGLGMRLHVLWLTIIYVAPNAVKMSQSNISSYSLPAIIVMVMSVILVKTQLGENLMDRREATHESSCLHEWLLS